MLIDIIKAKIEYSMRSKDTVSANLFRIIVSECQRCDKESDDFIVKYMGKIIEGNNEILKYRTDEKLTRENDLLRPYLPVLLDRGGVEQAAIRVLDEIRDANSDGRAIGVLSQYIGKLDLAFSKDDVRAVVIQIRSGEV